jgi:hypothetical protein
MLRCPEAVVGTEDPSSWVVCSRWRDAAREAHKLLFERKGRSLSNAIIATVRTLLCDLCSSFFLFTSFFQP